MARTVLIRLAGQTAITRHVGDVPFVISGLPAGSYEVDPGTGVWLPRTVTDPVSGGGAKVFVSDSFTGAGFIDERMPEVGGAWSRINSISANARAQISEGFVWGGTGTSAPQNVWGYQNLAEPATADYDVSTVIKRQTSLANRIYVMGRIDAAANSQYFVRYNGTNGRFELGKVFQNGTSQVLAFYALAMADGESRKQTLRMRGTSISMLIDNVQQGATITDTSITAKGFAGIKTDSQGLTGPSVGTNIDSFEAVNA